MHLAPSFALWWTSLILALARRFSTPRPALAGFSWRRLQ